ncbi:MAG: sarcosine oxidase subunit alpha family protein [Parvularculaceae bacterium]
MTGFRRTGRGRVDAQAPVTFTFDGKEYEGVKGDTLASALLANGVHFVGRSFKYHRPRGIFGAGVEEPNALVTHDRGPARATPNVRATAVELYDGLTVRSQNYWPSLKFDLVSMSDGLAPLLPAGFYNKTFMWPKSFWDSVYEPMIRRTAGLGPAPKAPDPDVYSSTYDHCEVFIAGAGPAGIAAALAASESGARVFLADEQAEPGGGLVSMPEAVIDGLPAWAWLEQSLEALHGRENVTVLPRTTVIGYYHDNFLGLIERLADHEAEAGTQKPRERLRKVRAGKVVLATGAIERPLVFADNDRPGIMLASAAQTYLNRYGVAVGDNAAVVTSHDSAYGAAFDLSDANIRIAAIVDARASVGANLLTEAERRGIEVMTGSTATGTTGRFRVREVSVGPIQNGKAGPARKIRCDAVLMSGGWTPSVHLWSHARGSLVWREDIGAYAPDVANENAVCAGACNGDFGLKRALEGGAEAGGAPRGYDVVERGAWSGTVVESPPSGRDEPRTKAFVDFQNDVTAKDIKLAIREGFKSIEHVKRYTTTGMANDQGKTSNLNGLQIASTLLGRPVEEVGLTTFRPPYTPSTFGALAGNNAADHFDVLRKTPVDAWAEANGAVFEPVSLWRRARYFPQSGEDMRAATARECAATRASLGIFDASTLGKIEVVGPDAAEFMNRMYTNPWKKLGVGRCRYALMLREDGYIMDDGVVGRLAEDRFHVTTTTGGAPRVLAVMEDYLQTEWPDLDVWLTSITEQWAVIALNGPNARKVLAPFVEDIDLSPDAFPHMAVREGRICGIETRLFRVSFTGELGFEVNVPAHYGEALWKILYEAGREYDVTPYGTETMHVLRAEKGFIIVGQDTDGTVTPDDAGLSWAVGRKKRDFVGKRSLARPDLVASGRKQLVGLMTDDPSVVLEEGAQIVATPDQPVPMEMIGHVTSSYWSAALNRSIALALVKDGRALEGKSVYVPMPDATLKVKICGTCFYDPQGERINVE